MQAAAPIAAATIRNAAGRVIDAFLATAQAQQLWEQVVRRAHTALVNVLEGKDAGPISTANGDVVLDLRPFLQRIAERLGVEDRLQQRAAASPTSGQIVILKSDQLDAAQKTVRILKALSSLLLLVVLALFALAVYLAHGRRRETFMRVGWCLLFVGVILAVIRRVVGGAVIDSLVQVEASKPAVNAVWLIETGPAPRPGDRIGRLRPGRRRRRVRGRPEPTRSLAAQVDGPDLQGTTGARLGRRAVRLPPLDGVGADRWFATVAGGRDPRRPALARYRAVAPADVTRVSRGSCAYQVRRSSMSSSGWLGSVPRDQLRAGERLLLERVVLVGVDGAGVEQLLRTLDLCRRTAATSD